MVLMILRKAGIVSLARVCRLIEDGCRIAKLEVPSVQDTVTTLGKYAYALQKGHLYIAKAEVMFEKTQKLRQIWNYLIVKFLSTKSVPLKQILADTHSDFQETGPLLSLLGRRDKDHYSLKIESDEQAQTGGFKFNEEAAKREVQHLEAELRRQDV